LLNLLQSHGLEQQLQMLLSKDLALLFLSLQQKEK
jgi:hypothetical protein